MKRLLCVLVITALMFSISEAAENTDDDFSDTPSLTSFDALDLTAARRIALSQNPSVAAALARVQQARERVTQARSAYWPRLTVSGTGGRVWFSETEQQLPGVTEGDADQFTADFTGSWVVFDGFERQFQEALARHDEQARREALMEARRLLLASVAAAFFNAQLAREAIAIAEADRAFNQRQAEEARLRKEVGTGSLSDVLNFEIQVNSARTALSLARHEYETARIALAALMGLAEATLPALLDLAELASEQDAEMTLPDSGPLVAYARNHRPDLLRAEYDARRAEAGVGVAEAGLYPSVNLSGSLNAERVDDPLYETDDFGGSLMLSFNYNLFEGGLTRAKIREAEASRREARNGLADLRITVSSQVMAALAGLRLAQEELRLQRANSSLVERNRELVEAEYKAGHTSLVRLNEAQRDLTQARGRLARALVGLRRAWQNLEAATGKVLTSFAEAQDLSVETP